MGASPPTSPRREGGHPTKRIHYFCHRGCHLASNDSWANQWPYLAAQAGTIVFCCTSPCGLGESLSLIPVSGKDLKIWDIRLVRPTRRTPPCRRQPLPPRRLAVTPSPVYRTRMRKVGGWAPSGIGAYANHPDLLSGSDRRPAKVGAMRYGDGGCWHWQGSCWAAVAKPLTIGRRPRLYKYLSPRSVQQRDAHRGIDRRSRGTTSTAGAAPVKRHHRLNLRVPRRRTPPPRRHGPPRWRLRITRPDRPQENA